MDSCLTATIAAGSHDLYMLHVTYGQRTAAREKRAFEEVGAALGAKKTMVVSIEHLKAFGASSLTDENRNVEVFDAGATGTGEIPSTYVPFRNGNLLAMACSWAEAIGADSVWIGAVQQDSSGYPDCRREFLEAFEKAVNLGTKPDTKISIRAPLLDLTKTDIVKRALEVGAPLAKTWSCYIAEDRACGTCESCGLRLRGFAGAGATDPIPYR
jgi:7-cyano-7-deazaguanine synthase